MFDVTIENSKNLPYNKKMLLFTEVLIYIRVIKGETNEQDVKLHSLC